MNIIHAFEQIQAMLRDLSPVLWSYQQKLMGEGFTREEAFELVKQFQKDNINNGGGS